MKKTSLHAAAVAALVAMGSLPAQAKVYSDSFTFLTQDQSLWASGAQASWSYDSGFIGGMWGGGFAASAPVGFGLNGIAGDANALLFPAIPSVQLTPFIPAFTTPAVPPQQITPYVPPQLITPYIPPQQITPYVPPKLAIPAIPAVYSPAIPATYFRLCNPFSPSDCWNGGQITPYIPPKLITPEVPAVYFPAIPATYTPAIPAVYTPAIPPTYTPAIPAITTPAVPATFSPATAAVYGDTRTGGSVDVKSSGALGFNVKAAADGGGLDVALPYLATLSVPDQFVAGKVHKVGATGTVLNNATIAVDAPSFSGSVNGIINTTNKLSGKGCFIGAGCTVGNTDANINETIEILSVDTTRPKPATALNGLLTLPVVLGQDMPIAVGGQTVGHVTINAPTDKSGGTVSGQTLKLDTNETLLRTTADIGGIAQLALGVPVDVLQPSIDIAGVASIGATILNVQGGINFGMSQALSFDANVDVTLTFDQDVYDRLGTLLGRSISFDLGTEVDIMFMAQPGKFSYTYSIGQDSLMTNDTSISVDPLFAIKAGCFNLSVAGGVLADIEECAYEQEFSTTNLLQASVYKKSFALEGFNTATFTVAVPEPQTYAMLLVGLGLMGLAMRRREPRR